MQFVCLFQILATEAELPTGAIGTLALNENRIFSPRGNIQFYLNTEDPATSDGIVERLRFCYSLNGGEGLYQATIGLYRPEGNGGYSLLRSFYVTRNASSDQERDQFVCEDMDIPSTQVQEGDLIGVCARNFNNSFRRINFVVNVGESRLERDLMRNDQNDFCREVGLIPSQFGNSQLSLGNDRLMRIFGFLSKCTKDHFGCLVPNSA